MAAEIKTQLNIPDLWYDFYSRFLPGTLFIAGLRILFLGNLSIPSLPEVLLLLGAAYITGLLSQPISSRIIGGVHWLSRKLAKIDDPLYVKGVQMRLGSKSRPTMILSKMHGEVAFFVQLMLLSLILLGILYYNSKAVWYSFSVPILPFIFAIEVSHRRIQRAKEYDKIYQNNKSAS
jgi:hypothetical protein